MNLIFITTYASLTYLIYDNKLKKTNNLCTNLFSIPPSTKKVGGKVIS